MLVLPGIIVIVPVTVHFKVAIYKAGNRAGAGAKIRKKSEAGNKSFQLCNTGLFVCKHIIITLFCKQ